MFRTRITFEAEAVLLDDERVPFANIDDASVDDGVLSLAIATGVRRIALKRADAMTVLDAVLDGIERTHPRSPYRSPAPTPADAAAPAHAAKWRRDRRATSGRPDLMIGRTFSAG